MPVSVKRTPFVDRPPSGGAELRVPQARVLRALTPFDLKDPHIDWPLLTRAGLGVRAGYTVLSGTVTRALNGICEGSSSGDAHPGLLARGLVESVPVDVDGVVEDHYRITTAGISAYDSFVARGGKLPAVKDASTCTNDRYTKPE